MNLSQKRKQSRSEDDGRRVLGGEGMEREQLGRAGERKGKAEVVGGEQSLGHPRGMGGGGVPGCVWG